MKLLFTVEIEVPLTEDEAIEIKGNEDTLAMHLIEGMNIHEDSLKSYSMEVVNPQ